MKRTGSGGKEPYGASKACTEIVVEAYRYSYFAGSKVQLASARAGNVIGGGDWAEDRLIPDAMRSFSDAQPLIVRNPSAVRPWQHVLEPLSGYLRLAEALAGGTPPPAPLAFNFGPSAEDAVPVRVIADQIVARWQDGAAWKHDTSVQPYEARLLEVDSAKARSVLGWTPRWRLKDALDRTVDWYKAYYEGHDMKALHAEADRRVSPWLRRPGRNAAARAGRRFRMCSSISACRRSRTPCATRRKRAMPRRSIRCKTFVCGDCKLVQIEDVQPAETHFHGNYTYFSSYSASWLAHAERYAGDDDRALQARAAVARHRGRQQRRLPAAVFQGARHSRARHRSGRQLRRGGAARAGHRDAGALLRQGDGD